MASTKLSALAAVSGPIQTTDQFYLLRAGASKRVAGAQMLLELLSSATSYGNGTARTLGDRFSDTLNIFDFGAVGDGGSHAMSAPEAAAYNSRYATYGATGGNAFVAGDEKDLAALQCALWVGAATGRPVYQPPSTLRVNRPVHMEWTATPGTNLPGTPKLCRFFGAGTSSVIRGYGIVAGRAVLEFLGESNAHAVNCEIAHIQVEEDPSCHKYSFCLRMGDGYCGIHLHRVICKGSQGMALRVGSAVSYAQICFLATQCQFWSNWANGWGTDVALDVYSVVPESLGSYWDAARFDSCFFWGQCDVRAFLLKFDVCMFICPPMRNTPYGCTMYLGTACWDTCYFEDHLVGIATLTATAGVPITNVTIRNCHFSSVNNLTPPANAQSSIQCARSLAQHGPVRIENCRFGGTTSYSDIDLYGPISVDVVGCCRAFGAINTAPTITRAGDVRLTVRNPNGELPDDIYEFFQVQIKCSRLIGPVDTQQTLDGAAFNYDTNLSNGVNAISARKVRAGPGTGNSELTLAAFPTGYGVPSLAGSVWVYSSLPVPMILGYDSQEKIRITDEPSVWNFAKLAGTHYIQTSRKTWNLSAADTSIYSGVGNGSVTIPAGTMRAGRGGRIRASGTLSTTGVPTVTFKLLMGATLMTSVSGIAASGLTSAGWSLDFEWTARSIGGAGTLIGQGTVILNGVAYHLKMTATVAFNTTVANTIDTTAAFSISDALNVFICDNYSMELI